MKIREKLQKSSGFTLAETLLAVLILLMVSTIVATGVPAAKNAYEKVVIGANAEILLSTAVTALRDELGLAKEVEIDESGTEITYISAKTGSKAVIYLGNIPDGTKPIMVQDYADLESNDLKNAANHRLVTEKAATEDLYVTYDTIEPAEDGRIVIIQKVEVFRKNGTSPLASLSELDIRILSEDASVNVGE